MLFVFMLPTLLCCLIIPSSRPLPPSPQIWLGGLPNQTRLAQVFLEKVKVQDLEEVLEPVFAMWKARGAKESFGSFVNRVVRATVQRAAVTRSGELCGALLPHVAVFSLMSAPCLDCDSEPHTCCMYMYSRPCVWL